MGFGSLSVCYLCVRVWRILSMWLFTVFTITFFPTLFLLIHFCQHILLSNHDCILFLFLFYKCICMTLSVIFFVFIIIAIQKMYNDISIHYDMLLGILNRTCWNRTRMERWNYVKKNVGMFYICPTLFKTDHFNDHITPTWKFLRMLKKFNLRLR